MNKRLKIRLSDVQSFRDELMLNFLGEEIRLKRVPRDSVSVLSTGGEHATASVRSITRPSTASHWSILKIALYGGRDVDRVDARMEATGRDFSLLDEALLAANLHVDYAYPYYVSSFMSVEPTLCVLDCVVAPGARRRAFFRRLSSALNNAVSGRLLRQL